MQEQEYIRRFAQVVEQGLDEGHGSCALRTPELRSIVEGALRHFEGQRHENHAWIIMPNHVHGLFSLRDGHKLEDVLQSWKGFSGREINRLRGASGAFWMKDYYDRMIRNSEHFWNCAGYIRRNPAKARLRDDGFTLFESDFVRRGLDETE